MRGSKLIIPLFLIAASNVFGQGSLTTISNAIYSMVYSGPTNLPPAMAEETWNFGRLTNMGSAATFKMLRTAGFTLSGPNDAAFLNTSNAVCVTNIPGIEGSGIFIHQMGGISNAGTLYISKTNRSVVDDSDTDLIRSVRVMATYVTNEATISNVGLGQRTLNITTATNRFISGDLFMFTGNNFHFSYFFNMFGLSIESNSLAGAYTAEDYLGRTWIDPKKVASPGGALDDIQTLGYGLQNAQHGTRWEFGWEFMSQTAVRVYAGPNEAIRTLDGLVQWNPMRSFFVEDVNSTPGGTTNRAIGLLIHSITVSYHKTPSWPAGSFYYETNGANPYGAVSFRGNVATANSGSFNDASVGNSPTNSTNLVNLAALQNALRTNGAVGSVTQTNFNLLQIYTNSSGLVQAYSGRIGLATAAVNGNAGILAFLSRDNGVTFSAVGGVSIGTTLAVTLAQAYTNGFSFALNTNDQCYFTNISSGANNSAGLIAGSGQVTLMGASTATTITSTASNAITAQYLIGDTNSRPFVYTNYAQGGTALTTTVHTNASTSPTAFVISINGAGTSAVNTNQIGINFGRVFNNPPLVFPHIANGQTNNAVVAAATIGTWHVSYNSITTSNFNLMSGGNAYTFVAGLTNVFEFLVIGQ